MSRQTRVYGRRNTVFFPTKNTKTAKALCSLWLTRRDCRRKRPRPPHSGRYGVVLDSTSRSTLLLCGNRCMILGKKFCNLPTLPRDTILLETAIRLVWQSLLNQLVFKQGRNPPCKISVNAAESETPCHLSTSLRFLCDKKQDLFPQGECDSTPRLHPLKGGRDESACTAKNP